MADLLPSNPDPDVGEDTDPRVIGVDSDDADALLSALQSETARDILAALYDEPATPSAVAEAADTSIQNVRYHLEKLEDADLVSVADTVYSEKGREMNVYAPAAKPLVVFAGGEDDAPGLEAALSRLLGALGVLGLSSLLVQRLFGRPGDWLDVGFTSASGDAAQATTSADAGGYQLSKGANATADATTGANGGFDDQSGTVTDTTRTATERGGDAATETAARTTRAATETAADAVRETTTAVADAGGTEALSSLPPGLVFFLGGLVVLVGVAAGLHLRAR